MQILCHVIKISFRVCVRLDPLLTRVSGLSRRYPADLAWLQILFWVIIKIREQRQPFHQCLITCSQASGLHRCLMRHPITWVKHHAEHITPSLLLTM